MYCCNSRGVLTLRDQPEARGPVERRPITTASADSRIFGLYRDFANLRLGVDNLKMLRFCNNDISVLFPESAVSKGMSPGKDENEADGSEAMPFIGGTLGWLTYVRPGGVGIVSGALANLGVPEAEAEVYEASLRRGRLLLCVRSSARNSLESTVQAFARAGAERVIAVRASRRNKGNLIDTREAPAEQRVMPGTPALA
jgi:hypothetical protein